MHSRHQFPRFQCTLQQWWWFAVFIMVIVLTSAPIPVIAGITYFNNKIRKIDATTGAFTDFATTGLNKPKALAFDTSGNLYVPDYVLLTDLRSK